MRRREDAGPACSRALDTCKRKLGPEHPQEIVATEVFVIVYSSTGRVDEAISLGTESSDLSNEVWGLGNVMTVSTMEC